MSKNATFAAISPVADTGIRPTAEFQSSALKTHGVVLDAADQGRMVRIRRRSTNFILIREDRLMAFVTEAADPSPKTLDDLLYGFTPEDGAALRASVAGWTNDEPTGGELL